MSFKRECVMWVMKRSKGDWHIVFLIVLSFNTNVLEYKINVYVLLCASL